MIERLKNEYGFKEASSIEGNQLETDKGVKQLCYWKDEDCLKWHIAWRDHCSVAPYMIMNRMLRTKKGSAYIQEGDAYISVHDVIRSNEREKGSEAHWGELVGVMIINGREDRTVKPLSGNIEQEYPFLEQANRQQKLFFYTFLQEANRRLNQAKKVLRADEIEVPKMANISNLRGGIYGSLFVVEGGTEKPEYGYDSLNAFLKEWYLNEGEQSLEALLDAVDQKAQLTAYERKAIMATVLLPDELKRLNQVSETMNEAEVSEVIAHLKEEWDRTQSFASTLAKWLDSKKVKK
ncbi:hypothetical protein MM326_13385 [Alkalihalobacillus sp. LMS6]|uniref:hypothetical protein n=1 Tax=Alkalihalobacillus sp. LMS6 TaxID=2924034 RepID=UPI0020D14B53|nr:hypothetical protein [Alkalihalobacillus sp. LMS6]UTR05104.1 hypothetical protein MM326_13385 [Alkalihalobacillus sp. LMS6]